MNKDARNLTRLARLNLAISDTQLKQEVESRKQKYFKPTESKLGEGTLKEISKLVTCMMCDRIPLDIRECHNCQRIFCKYCLAKLKKEAAAISDSQTDKDE